MNRLSDYRAWMAAGLMMLAGGCNPAPSAPAKVNLPAAKTPNAAADTVPEQTEPEVPAETPAGKSDVTLKPVDLDEFQAILAAHKGKVVLVDFWATYCAPCRQQFPHTVEMAHKYADKGFVAISVCCDEPEKDAEALQFLKKSHATFENLRAKTGADEATYTAYNIEGGALPHYKLFDRTGKLAHTFGTDPTADKQFTSEEIDAKVKEVLEAK